MENTNRKLSKLNTVTKLSQQNMTQTGWPRCFCIPPPPPPHPFVAFPPSINSQEVKFTVWNNWKNKRFVCVFVVERSTAQSQHYCVVSLRGTNQQKQKKNRIYCFLLKVSTLFFSVLDYTILRMSSMCNKCGFALNVPTRKLSINKRMASFAYTYLVPRFSPRRKVCININSKWFSKYIYRFGRPNSICLTL